MDGQKHQRPLLLTKVLIIICHPQDYLDYLDYCTSYPGSGLLVVYQMYEQENFYIRPFIVIGNLSLLYLVFLLCQDKRLCKWRCYHHSIRSCVDSIAVSLFTNLVLVFVFVFVCSDSFTQKYTYICSREQASIEILNS